MTVRIVLLSGPLAVGKTAVATILTERYAFRKISSSAYLRAIALERELEITRENLQEIGDSLDAATDFGWLADPVASSQIAAGPHQQDWFVDAVRKPEQVSHFRAQFSRVVHVHFTADEDLLRERFFGRARMDDGVGIVGSYDRAIAHPNEQSARSMGSLADLLIDLGTTASADAAATIDRHFEEL